MDGHRGGCRRIQHYPWTSPQEGAAKSSARRRLLASVQHYSHTQPERPRGEIQLRPLFTLEIITKTRKNTSTLYAIGRTMMQIGHILMGAGKGVVYGVTGTFRRRNSQSSGSSTGAPDSPGVVVSKPVDNGTLTLTQQQRPSLPPRRMRRVTTKKRAPCRS